MHKEGKSGIVPHSYFPLFIKNRAKHFMYHTKVSFAGGSHGKHWPRSSDDPPPLQGTVSQGAAAGPWRMPTKTALSGNSQLGVGVALGQFSPPHPMAKVRYSKVPR
jgi:hypothetical protein